MKRGKEHDASADDQLSFELTQNHSVVVPFEKRTVPLNETSISGYVALTGEIVNVADAYHLPAGTPYKISRSFDEKSGYRTKSMLVVPMRDHDQKVIGVIQLINKKRDARVGAAAGLAGRGDGDPLHLRGRGAGHLAGQPGRGGLREHQAHPGHPEPVRFLRGARR